MILAIFFIPSVLFLDKKRVTLLSVLLTSDLEMIRLLFYTCKCKHDSVKSGAEAKPDIDN